MKKEKSCGAVIVDDEGKILIIKHNVGHWAFPKGHIENLESEVDTALREVREETGLIIDIDSSIREVVTYSPMDDVIKDVVYFLGRPITKKIVLQECEVCDYFWGEYEECLNYLTYDNDKEVLKNIYSKWSSRKF